MCLGQIDKGELLTEYVNCRLENQDQDSEVSGTGSLKKYLPWAIGGLILWKAMQGMG